MVPPIDLQSCESLAELFKLLSDSTRLRILSLLASGERNVSSLCEALQLPQPTVSHHLGLLRMRNVIVNRRSGKQVFYELDGHVLPQSDRTLEIRSDGYTVRVTPPTVQAGREMPDGAAVRTTAAGIQRPLDGSRDSVPLRDSVSRREGVALRDGVALREGVPLDNAAG